ncbi:phytoene/squalene synthase family protein [Nocardia farcinica]|uniref:phytoene/squalene synthase family protein n=1 Tax=Nocardia farcinica TaxID=37329 RepID=UPI00189399F5|nr:phytoene/squalene synthase family protein [Nocardia farcinica]MBF6231895.1 phytoene/squalene synthase family protein [Nocardia farcinica]MBF6444682.1 phytoene/squalene synthase family protein [Nocardia farcinica]
MSGTRPVDPAPADLAPAYRTCRRIAADHGRTYFLATRLLTPAQRPAVHALYAFARLVDDIVDVPGPAGGGDPVAALDVVEDRLRAALAAPARPDVPRATAAPGAPAAPITSAEAPGRRSSNAAGRAGAAPLAPAGTDVPRPADGSTTPDAPCPAAAEHGRTHADRPARAALDPRLPAEWPHVLAALADTVARYAIAPQHFWTFLDSMRMDVPGSSTFRARYADMAELREYMRGSAAAIGLQMVPVLGTVGPRAAAEPAAAALGEAFQLTNFLRDVAEDLDRGRVYLPAAELAAFGVTDELLGHCRATGHTDPRVRRALAHLIAVNRDLYRRAAPGVDLLTPRVRPAIRTASALYAAILDRIEDSGYAVFTARAVVPRRRRAAVAAREFAAGILGLGR